MINSFKISGFRGINKLSVDRLNNVNLIVGDNNSGKTSILEALHLLRSPSQVSNLYRAARLRDFLYSPYGSVGLYENVVCLFPHSDNLLSIGVSAAFDDQELGCFINARQSRIMIDAAEADSTGIRKTEMLGETEADQLQGTIEYVEGKHKGKAEFKINTFSKLSGSAIDKKKDILRLSYVSPCAHLQGNIISQIIRTEGYKDICVRALQLFDEEIEDILVLKSTAGNRSIDYIRHRSLGLMPLMTYGDGIKKVLVLAEAIAAAKNGILLIDEVETSIHKKYYDDIFRFIVKACLAFNVQAFITTHSIEAVDGLLATQDYQKQTTVDNISVITVKRANNLTYSRILSGREVAADREAFGFEVRL